MAMISTPDQLQTFREEHLNADAFHQAVLNTPGALFFPLPTGIGKSALIDSFLDDFHANPDSWMHDLAIVSAPTHKILQERRIVSNPEASSVVAKLSGRPFPRCGKDNNDRWKVYQDSASIALGKQEICGDCTNRSGCSWPEQFQNLTPRIRIVLLPQKYLDIFPGVLHQIIAKTNARLPLILLDETNFSQDIFRRHIKRGSLENFLKVLDIYIKSNEVCSDSLDKYRQNIQLLLMASAEEIASGGRFFQPLDGDLAAAIQKIGIDQYGEMFYYPGFDLATLSQQDPGSRHLLEGGHIGFVCVPKLEEPGKLVVFSGTASKLLLEHRLDTRLTSMYSQYRFHQEDTRFYNINIGGGIGQYHRTHLPQILFFTLGYIKKTMKRNQTVALVTKKKFVEETVLQLNALLDDHFMKSVRVVPAGSWTGSHPGQREYHIPLLHYGGAIGVNNFSMVDCIVCLCGYYMRMGELNRMVNEVVRAPYQTMFRIMVQADPLRRVAIPEGGARHYNQYVQNVADAVLQQEEMGVVIQAVGRVRPFTNPREVITCQFGQSEVMPYDIEFPSMDEARKFFGIPSERAYEAAKTAIPVQYGKILGMTQRKISEVCGIPLRSVTRNWNVYNTDFIA